MGRHSGASDTYSGAYPDTPADAYGHTHTGQEPYGDPGPGSGEYPLPGAGAYYAVVDTSGAYAPVGHGYAGENAYAAPGHPGGQYQPYQEPGYAEPAALGDPVLWDAAPHEPAYREPAYHDAGFPEQGGYAAFVPQTPQAPQQPYWDDPAAWETAPADPFHDTGGQQAYGGHHDPAFQQAGAAYAPEAYAEAYPQPTPQRVLEPEFDPEPAAWREAVRVEPVDEPVSPRRRARAAAPAGGAFASLTDESLDSLDSDVAADVDDVDGYVPRATATATAGSGGSGRAASRRASRTPARKPRRIAAAGGAVVTGAVLAGVVVVQMPDNSSQGQASGDTARQDTQTRDTEDAASRDSERGQVQAVPNGATPGPSTIPLPTPGAQTTTDRLKLRFDLDPQLSLPGKFDAVPAKADTTTKSGSKTKTYRIEIEQGLALDADLFAETVQQTLNDPRSWAHDGRSFVQTGGSDADFVIRLASPGTTHRLCGVVGLDTSEDNVSCDAAGTPYVVINAWRWAQGSPTFGDEMVSYRQMLINHEVGHRLGRNHETEACMANDLAPVMMQQTKSLEADNGLVCKPNAWPYPA
ncbi:DUF3152 domain-containing protein [Yinghuangia sp. ASG 101]|uniref:DUF3152 domain-containing protein n=1 Tax=Yinghuangia sp. ASG 101 TaxID=2896848 RepID=UPI001E5E202B|nr:DUF3152 domain-containing protein [Yinghuangia sp. ASG 101]UGQ14403.1 DUF3152 domain-containing protein [Yinghuangia sp. ASG 101]